MLIGVVLSSPGACAPRPETRPTPPPAPTAPAKPKEIPRQTVPTPQPTPEKGIEPGWQRYRSATLRYQVDYPPEFSAVSDSFLISDGKYMRTGIFIGTEPVNKGVTTEDYVKQMMTLMQINDRKVIQLGGMEIAGRKASLLGIPARSANEYDEVRAVFIDQGKAWLFNFMTLDRGFQPDPRFMKMLSSFKFLQ